MFRRFVNIVAQNYKSKTATYSLHRVDVAKHLFHRSRDDAQVMPLVAEAQDGSAGGGDEPQMIERLELPPPTTTWHGSKLEFFGLGNSDGRILCTDEAGDTLLYDANSNFTIIVPSVNDFKGPVPVSVSAPRTGAKEDDMYIMHGGLEPRFSILRCGTLSPGSYWEVRQWQSLPLSPLLARRLEPALISSYMVVDGGQSIFLSSAPSSAAGDKGVTFGLDTVSREWRRASNWALPFDGRAEYVPDLKLGLGFSLHRPCHLCAISGLSISIYEQPTSPIIWQDHKPEEWTATSLNLLSLGSGRFAIAKVFKVVRNTGESGFFNDRDMVEDELAVLTGVELGGYVNGDDLQGLQMLKHKSICYTCANNTIHRVL